MVLPWRHGRIKKRQPKGNKTMSDSILPPEILGLPTAIRLSLVEQLWDSIANENDEIVLTDSQKAELDRRLELRLQHSDRSSPWTTVRQRLLDSL
jgi:putative addiction module component (TIGR02574 family)